MLYGMPGIMKSALHVCSCEEMCVEFLFEFFKYDFFSVLGSDFQRFGPYTLNDLLTKVCFLMFGTAIRAFLFSDLRPG